MSWLIIGDYPQLWLGLHKRYDFYNTIRSFQEKDGRVIGFFRFSAGRGGWDERTETIGDQWRQNLNIFKKHLKAY
jgi:hypothetical protein